MTDGSWFKTVKSSYLACVCESVNIAVTLVMMSLNWLSFQASVGWFIMVRMALSYSSYLSYKNTNSGHR